MLAPGRERARGTPRLRGQAATAHRAGRAAIALVVIAVAAVGFVLFDRSREPLRRSQVTPVVRTVDASPGVTGRCHAAGGGRRRQLCDVGRGGHHRGRRAGVLRTSVDDKCRDLVAVSG